MEHRSTSQKAPRGLRTLLLAGSTLVCAGTASAEPIQPFWLMPTAVANSLGIEKAAAADQVKALRAKVFAQQTVNLLSLETLDSETNEYDVPLPFSETAADNAPVTLRLRSGSFDIEPATNVKVGRLASGAGFASAEVGTESVGFDAEMFDGRLAISSDFAKTIDTIDNVVATRVRRGQRQGRLSGFCHA
jgi:hypothetical protein